MRNKFAALLAALALIGGGLFAASPAPAQAAAVTSAHHRNWHPVLHSDAAYTFGYYSTVRGVHDRIVYVKCHSDNSWHAMGPGQNTTQVCPGGQNGWIERTWVDADRYLRVKNRTTHVETTYPYGCNCQIGGGNYDMYLCRQESPC
jgi:hypothetical protein